MARRSYDGREFTVQQQPPRDPKDPSFRDLLRAIKGSGGSRSPEREELCRRLQRIAARHARSFLTRHGYRGDDVEEVTQLILIAQNKSAHKYDERRGAPATFFWKVARRACAAWMRKRTRDRLVTGLDARELVDHRDDGRTRREEREHLLAQLPFTVRFVFYRRIAGVTLDEIALELSMSADALRQMLSRALRHLRLPPDA